MSNRETQIGELISNLDVTNVFVYVGDAVRDDFLPEKFKNRGAYVRTISSSIHSPASFASIATGQYPPTHGVASFSDRLAADTPRIFDIPDTDTRFLNSIFAYATEEHGLDVDPIHSVLDTDAVPVDSPFEGLEEPFVTMERGPGGHAPYGDFTGTATEYFKKSSNNRETIVSDYKQSIKLDIKLFDRRIRELEEKGHLKDTLVIYTSDHGELLGEGGLLGHNDPMRPELVYVPTIFYHPALPNQELTETTLHHVDILPTILSALGYSQEEFDFDGHPVPKGFEVGPRPCFWKNRFLPEWVRGISGKLSYEGVWDDSGGVVFTKTNRLDRYSVLAGKLFRSSKRTFMGRNLYQCISSYWWNVREFGSPSFDKEAAKEVLQRAKQNSSNGRKAELSSEEKERLRDLGYLN